MSATPEDRTRKSQTLADRRWGKALSLVVLLSLGIAGDNNGFRMSAPQETAAELPLRPGLAPGDHVTANPENASLPQVLAMYGELTGRTSGPKGWSETLNDLSGGHLAKWRIVRLPQHASLLTFHADGRWRADELKDALENILRTNHVVVVPAR